MSNFHVWDEDGKWYWDDAEDHGGLDRNVPCGPFNSRDLAVADARQIDPNANPIDGKPPRY